MPNGILAGALMGAGAGVAGLARLNIEQDNQLERMDKQKEIQLDLERERAALLEELRAKRSDSIRSTAESRLAPNATSLDRSRAFAQAEAEYNGAGYGTLAQLDQSQANSDRSFNEDVRHRKVTEGQAAAAESRQATMANLQGQALQQQLDTGKDTAEGRRLFREAALAGDEEGAARIAKAYGFGNGEKIGRYQFRQEEDDMGRKHTAVYDSTTGLRVGESSSLQPRPSAQQRQAGQSTQQRPALTQFITK